MPTQQENHLEGRDQHNDRKCPFSYLYTWEDSDKYITEDVTTLTGISLDGLVRGIAIGKVEGDLGFVDSHLDL